MVPIFDSLLLMSPNIQDVLLSGTLSALLALSTHNPTRGAGERRFQTRRQPHRESSFRKCKSYDYLFRVTKVCIRDPEVIPRKASQSGSHPGRLCLWPERHACSSHFELTYSRTLFPYFLFPIPVISERLGVPDLWTGWSWCTKVSTQGKWASPAFRPFSAQRVCLRVRGVIIRENILL